MAAKICSPSDGRWCSNLLAIRKRTADGTIKLRLAIDLRELNRKLLVDQFGIGDMETCLHGLAKARYLCKFDFTSAYHGISVDNETSELLGFKTQSGTWKFNVLPFGICCGSATFSRLMTMLLQKISLPGANAFLDDLVVAISDFSEGKAALKKIFEAIRESGLRLSPAKCEIMVKRTNVLGWEVADGCIKPTVQRYNAIMGLEFPDTKRKIRKMVGMILFIRNCYKNLAVYLAPFYDSLKQNNKVIKTPQMEEAFNELKKILADPKTLHIYRHDLKTVIQSDSSNTHWAATLWNENENGERFLCAHASGGVAVIAQHNPDIVWSVRRHLVEF